MRRTGARLGRRPLLRGGLALAAVGPLGGCGLVPRWWGRARVPRIGFLMPGPATSRPELDAFRRGLRELGYVEGDNIAVEYRFSEGRDERLPQLAAELVGLEVDLLVTAGNRAADAAKGATGTIPIVLASVGDPVGSGLVASLARPGGNVTGLVGSTPQINAKRLEVLKEALPGAGRVAALANDGNASHALFLREIAAAAQSLGLQLQPLAARSPEQIAQALGAAAAGGAQALLVLGDPIFLAARALIAQLALEGRLPTVSPERDAALAGGLIAYGPSIPANFQRAASFVDRILKGASPAELPVEQPTTIDFVVNLKTARGLELTIPTSVLQQATELIQ